MLLKNERLKEISEIRNKNEEWKRELDRQLLQKELIKQNQSMVQNQKDLIEEERIHNYNQALARRSK